MIGQYLRMIRVHIVAGGLLAFTLGALLAFVNGGSFDPWRFALFYAVIFFGDLSTHFSNDYFDVSQDRLVGGKSVFSGSKMLVSNPNMMRPARRISVVLLCVSIFSAVLGLGFGVAPVELLLIAFGINFLGWFYSAPPLRFVSRGLGEVAIALAVGVGIPAVGYLSGKGHFDGWFGLFAVPFLLYGFMLALSLEAPDVEVDRLSDKKTVGAFRGVSAVFGLACVVAFAAFLIFLGCAWLFGVGVVDFLVVAAFAAVPVAASVFGVVGVKGGKRVETLSAVNVLALFAVNVLIVVYLLGLWLF